MKKGTRKDTRLNLRVAPLYAFYFKKYAENQNLNLKQAFSDAISCLMSSGVSPARQQKWLREYVKIKGSENALD
jgi:catalase (peroxidase I)